MSLYILDLYDRLYFARDRRRASQLPSRCVSSEPSPVSPPSERVHTFAMAEGRSEGSSLITVEGVCDRAVGGTRHQVPAVHPCRHDKEER